MEPSASILHITILCNSILLFCSRAKVPVSVAQNYIILTTFACKFKKPFQVMDQERWICVLDIFLNRTIFLRIYASSQTRIIKFYLFRLCIIWTRVDLKTEILFTFIKGNFLFIQPSTFFASYSFQIQEILATSNVFIWSSQKKSLTSILFVFDCYKQNSCYVNLNWSWLNISFKAV